MDLKKIGLFAGGVLFGTAGIKALSSKDAKKAYTQTTAAALRVKDSVMNTVTAVRENADDIYAGAQAIIEPKKLGFLSNNDEKQDYERMKSGVMEEVRRLFKPEFLNRIDEIMVFHPLNKTHIKKIVNIMLKTLEKRCKEQLDIQLKITESVKDFLAEAGFDSKYGARPLRRAIQTKLEDPMANKILDGEIKTGDIVKVQLQKKEIHFVPVREEKVTKAKSKKDIKS